MWTTDQCTIVTRSTYLWLLVIDTPSPPYPPHSHPHHLNISHLCLHSLAVTVSAQEQFCVSLYTIVLYNVDCVDGSVGELLLVYHCQLFVQDV